MSLGLHFLVMAVVVVVVVTCSEFGSSTTQCHFINAFRQQFHLNSLLLVWEQRNQLIKDDILRLLCPGMMMMAWIRLEPKLCLAARHSDHRLPRLFVFSPATVPIQSLQQIVLSQCDIDNVLLYMLDREQFVQLLFNEVYISVNCRFLIAYPESTGVNYHLTEVYRHDIRSPFHVKNYGVWSPSKGFAIQSLPSIYQQRDKFHGLSLKMGISLLPPFSDFGPQTDGKMFDGVLYDVWMIVTEQLQIRPLNMFINAESPGNIKVNNTWMGLIGEILKKKIQLGMTVGYDNKRREAIGFVREIIKEEYHVFLRHEEIASTEGPRHLYKSYLEPFGPSLWGCIFCSILVLFTWEFILYSILEVKGFPGFYEYIESFFYLFGIVCQQGASFRPCLANYLSGRITIYMFYICFLVIYQSYSSCIISFLVEHDHDQAFNDIGGLLDNGEFVIDVSKSSSVFQKIRDSPDEQMKHLYGEYILPNLDNRPSNEEGLRNVLTMRRYSFITLNSMGRSFFKSYAVDIFHFPLNRQATFLTIIIEKDCPYKRFLDNKVLRVREFGVLHHIKMKYLAVNKPLLVENIFVSLPLEKTIFPFAILFLGHILALVFFIIEILYFKFYYFKLKAKVPRNNDDFRIKVKMNNKIY